MYVVDECNIETHGMTPYAGRLADDPEWEDALMLRLSRMVARDQNHACVVMWSLGNESGSITIQSLHILQLYILQLLLAVTAAVASCRV